MQKQPKNIKRFHVIGTPEQFRQIEENCSMSEAMFATTLWQRLKNRQPDEPLAEEDLIMEWFKSVRMIAQANYVMSGVQLYSVTPAEKVVAITKLVEGCGVTLAPDKAEAIRKIIAEVDHHSG